MLRWNVLGLAVAVLLVGDQARGDSLYYMGTDRFAYSGSITEYSSLSNAQMGIAPISSFNVGPVDLSIAATNDVALFGSASFNALTAWYYTTAGGTPGVGNPNNVNTGFVQLQDGTQSSVTSSNAFFSNSALTSYTLQVTGGNANTSNTSDPRLGPNNTNSDAPSSSTGTFVSYNLSATFSNLNPAALNAFGLYESDDDPANINVAGTFSGIFQNLSTTSPSLNGFYAFNFTLNNTSWANANSSALAAAGDPFVPSFFVSDTAVPEPGSLLMASIAAGTGLIAAVWRGRKKPGVQVAVTC